MEITLVKRRGEPCTVCIGGHSFPIENGEVVQEPTQRAGCEVMGKLPEFIEAFELAEIAWKTQEFDLIEDND